MKVCVYPEGEFLKLHCMYQVFTQLTGQLFMVEIGDDEVSIDGGEISGHTLVKLSR
jgi:hypothetical protein